MSLLVERATGLQGSLGRQKQHRTKVAPGGAVDELDVSDSLSIPEVMPFQLTHRRSHRIQDGPFQESGDEGQGRRQRPEEARSNIVLLPTRDRLLVVPQDEPDVYAEED